MNVLIRFWFVFFLVRSVLIKPNVKGLEDEEEAPLPLSPL